MDEIKKMNESIKKLDLNNLKDTDLKEIVHTFIGKEKLKELHTKILDPESDSDKIIADIKEGNRRAFHTIGQRFTKSEKNYLFILELAHIVIQKSKDIDEGGLIDNNKIKNGVLIDDDINNSVNNTKTISDKVKEKQEKITENANKYVMKFIQNQPGRADPTIIPPNIRRDVELYKPDGTNYVNSNNDEEKRMTRIAKSATELYSLQPAAAIAILNNQKGGGQNNNINKDTYRYNFFNYIIINNKNYEVHINNTLEVTVCISPKDGAARIDIKQNSDDFSSLKLRTTYYENDDSIKPLDLEKYLSDRVRAILSTVRTNKKSTPSPQQVGGDPLSSKDELSVVKDLENIRNLKNNFQNIDNLIKEIDNEWKTYETTVPAMNFNDTDFYYFISKLTQILDKLKSKLSLLNNDTRIDKTAIESYNGYIAEYNKVLKGFKDYLQKSGLDDIQINRDQLDNIKGSRDIETRDIEKRKTKVTEDLYYFGEILKEFKSNNVKSYTNDDIIKINGFFTNDNGKNIKKRISDKFDTIIKEIRFIANSLLNYSKNYVSFNQKIKINILEKLQPKQLDKEALDIEIIKNITGLKLKIVQDIDTMYNAFQSRNVSSKQRGGAVEGVEETVNAPAPAATANAPPVPNTPKMNDFKTIISDNRVKIKDELGKYTAPKDTDKDATINSLTKIHNDLYNIITKLKDPSQASVLGPTNYESIFNVIYKKYIENKTQNEKTDYEASSELIDSLKVNNLLPEKIFQIDLRDKLIFIGTTLLIRVFALYLVELMIDKTHIMKLDYAIFGFLTIFTLLFIILVIIVNTDTYKLRIIYNYINLHTDPSKMFIYILMLWLFGAIIYFIMNSINDNTISSAINEEERAKLKYKLQVLTMIIWIFNTIIVLVI